jgi:hypothetical protein
MRRTHLRGRENIWKRQLIHVCAFNLSLIFRQILGAGTPRELRSRKAGLVSAFMRLQIALLALQQALDFNQHGSGRAVRPTGPTATGGTDPEISGVAPQAARFPTPEQAEAGPMPSDHSFVLSPMIRCRCSRHRPQLPSPPCEILWSQSATAGFFQLLAHQRLLRVIGHPQRRGTRISSSATTAHRFLLL